MGKKSSTPPPDYSPIANAQMAMAEDNREFQQEQFDWAKKTYAKDRKVTDQVVTSFLDTAATTKANSEKDRARYEEIYQPLENKLASEALDYASQERKDLEVGRAQAAVGQQFAAARKNAERHLEGYGVNPSDVRYAGLDVGVRAQEAATKAAAGNQASQMVDATGRALRSEAINVGKGYPGQIAQSYGTSLNAGTGAVNTGLATTASGANTMGTGVQYGQMAANNYTGAATTMNTGYQNQLAYEKQQQSQSSGIGSLVGLAGSLATTAIPGGSMLGRMFAADGGAIPDPSGADPEMTTGGKVPARASPSSGRGIDDVPAALTVGEFVVPKDVAHWKGEEYFQKLITKSREDKGGAVAKPKVGMAIPQAPTFQSGVPA